MTKLDRLISIIQEDPNVIRFKQLEAIIDHDVELQTKYKDVLDAQKVMVQKEAMQHKDYLDAKEHYESLQDHLLQHVLMSEYLDLLQILNEDINLIQTIIEDEINKDFD
jgi:cell fate (sporulation/competence/biofilm development) regulator YmcA (YheA/YmcA/DUF963 family)